MSSRTNRTSLGVEIDFWSEFFSVELFSIAILFFVRFVGDRFIKRGVFIIDRRS